jgi:cell division protein FtsB
MFRSEQHMPETSPTSRINLWFWLLVLAVFALSGLAVVKGTMQVMAAQGELQAIQQVNKRLKVQNEALYQQALRLKQDPRALEKACRQDLDLVRAGEVVYLEPGYVAKPLAPLDAEESTP